MTENDAKEWVTIKIPENIRDDAREDPRTYGEIMQAGLTNDTTTERESVFGLPEYDRHNEVLAELEKVFELMDRVPERTVERLEGRR